MAVGAHSRSPVDFDALTNHREGIDSVARAEPILPGCQKQFGEEGGFFVAPKIDGALPRSQAIRIKGWNKAHTCLPLPAHPTRFDRIPSVDDLKNKRERTENACGNSFPEH